MCTCTYVGMNKYLYSFENFINFFVPEMQLEIDTSSILKINFTSDIIKLLKLTFYHLKHNFELLITASHQYITAQVERKYIIFIFSAYSLILVTDN